MRKVYVHNGWREERIYLGGYELYRKYVTSPESLDSERETLHISDDARRVCMVETLTVTSGSPVGSPTPRFRYQYDNHLGTACVEADTNGAVISYEEYHPYGTSSYRSFTSSEVSSKRYRYTGKERDEETSLYYHGARYYAPWLGRWMSADPAGTVDGGNLYAYVRGSPIGLVDPNGMQGETGEAIPLITKDPPPTPRPAPEKPIERVVSQADPDAKPATGVKIDDLGGGREGEDAGEESSLWEDIKETAKTVKEAAHGAAVGTAESFGVSFTDEPTPDKGLLGVSGPPSLPSKRSATFQHWRGGARIFWGAAQAAKGLVHIVKGGGTALATSASGIGIAVGAAEAGAGLALVGVGVTNIEAGMQIAQSTGSGESAGSSGPKKENYRGRYNAARHKQGKSRLPADYDAHHRIPQEYRDHPEFEDFDFDAPENIRGVKGSRADVNVHQDITNKWAEFRRENPGASRTQIEDFARQIDVEFGKRWWR